MIYGLVGSEQTDLVMSVAKKVAIEKVVMSIFSFSIECTDISRKLVNDSVSFLRSSY